MATTRVSCLFLSFTTGFFGGRVFLKGIFYFSASTSLSLTVLPLDFQRLSRQKAKCYIYSDHEITYLEFCNLFLLLVVFFVFDFLERSMGDSFPSSKAVDKPISFVAPTPTTTSDKQKSENNWLTTCNLILTISRSKCHLLEAIPKYVKAIMTPEDKSFPRLNCPAPKEERYTYLRTSALEASVTATKPRYFFALDLYESANKLPRLLGSIVEAIKFLGPVNCALSIVEWRSNDGTYEVLDSLRVQMETIGEKYHLMTSNIDPTAGDRVKRLAELRNLALKPLTTYPFQYRDDTTVVFLNDVSICMEDILELIHQRMFQGADMTCAMDWTFVGQDPTFYDVWKARGMNGDSFIEVPTDSNWDLARNIFWNNPNAFEHYHSHKSFQVFSCWKGAIAITAKPFLENKIEFEGVAIKSVILRVSHRFYARICGIRGIKILPWCRV
jgi:alpha-1,3-mannosyltransferase